ncbi:FAR1 DNA binding domain, Zinc finger, SWIM-type, MULE transposase domain, FHY3/FAR1 family [Artemisia annua]|uniref:FAR1 DNA binding domain, Zinc finger, SWIM-type, MULE transposase domain, FHY3/FAR1 family n=1 Tax=Artemisia annua TaxID=35608 RepID=A0A2U1Q9C6_ARTAN|nr:FAR1 DNA binding domain, Zinc finger, SWIM-type, MULE transposase domain, FHY3/FAR1 family [Artemisia annua]
MLMAQTDTHVFNQDNDYEPVPYSVGVVSEEAGEKLWVPDIPIGEKPAYGMMYYSLEQAYEYYKDYAKRAGFEVGPDLAKDETFKRRISYIVWNDRIEPEEFEDLWERLLVDFDLKSHEWLLDMYNLRHKWIPTYYRNELMSGLMRTSSRFESENNAYGRLTSIDLTLWEFYNHFDSVVLCKPSDELYQCTCKRFESYGLLCRHIFYVIRLSKVKTFPKKYVLRRWSQDSLPPASVIQASGDTPDMILREIFKSVEYCVNRYANEPELLQKFRDHQVQLMAKADADVPIPKQTNKRDRIASILGVSQPEEIIVNVPKQIVLEIKNHLPTKTVTTANYFNHTKQVNIPNIHQLD